MTERELENTSKLTLLERITGRSERLHLKVENQNHFSPEFKPEFKPDLRHESYPTFNHEFKPEFKPEITNNFEPVFNPEFHPTFNADFNPSFNPEFKHRIAPKIEVYVNGAQASDVRTKVSDGEVEEDIDTNPLEKYNIGQEPFYISHNGEDALFKTAFDNKMPLMLKGPTGCGKTRFVEHMAYKVGVPLITVSCQEDLSASDLSGRLLLNQQGTYWQDGPLALAARHGAICYLDEVVEARNDAMVLIHSLTDYRRILPIDKTGEVIEAHPNFMLVTSFNPHYQSSFKKMKQSTRQRFVSMEFDYMPKDKELEIIAKESGVNKEMAEKLVDFGISTRELRSRGLEEGASTRLLIYAGKLINQGVNPSYAVQNAVTYSLTDEPDLQESINEIRDVYFPGE